MGTGEEDDKKKKKKAFQQAGARRKIEKISTVQPADGKQCFEVSQKNT